MSSEDLNTPNKENKNIITTENLSFIYDSVLKNPKLNLNLSSSSTSTSSSEEPADENQRTENKVDKETEQQIYENLKVLKNINLTIEKGKFIAICGNTGCGKSTLVRTFNGLIPHFYSGRFYGYVRVFDKDTIDEKISDLSLHIGLVFQNPENQLVAMTVEREIAFGLENRGIDPDAIKKKINEVLNLLNIQHLRKRHPYELSGGEQQRVAIASILSLEPEIIILDEPTASLDPKAALNVIQLLKKINTKRGITIIIIEHRLDMILPYCDDVILMQNGKILDYDSVEKVLNSELIYEMGIEIPRFIDFFHELKKSGKYKGIIPKNIEQAAEFLEGFFIQ